MDGDQPPAGETQRLADLADRLAKAARRAGRRAAVHDWADTLAALAEAEQLADQAIRAAAQGARDAGWSWNRIGPAAGVTQQAAWRRFSNPRRELVRQADTCGGDLDGGEQNITMFVDNSVSSKEHA